SCRAAAAGAPIRSLSAALLGAARERNGWMLARWELPIPVSAEPSPARSAASTGFAFIVDEVAQVAGYPLPDIALGDLVGHSERARTSSGEADVSEARGALALIGVVDQARPRPAACEGHLQRVDDQLGAHVVGHRRSEFTTRR